jgi:hypothetical protein
LRELGSQAKSHSRAPATKGNQTTDAFLIDQLTVLLMIGAREVNDEKGDEDALTLPTSRANLLAKKVEVLALLEDVDGLMINVNAVRPSTVANALTLAMRDASTRKYSAIWSLMAEVSPSSARKAA